jgi:LPS O-antigen subunit length determinant protein (WzzB/FepE family)
MNDLSELPPREISLLAVWNFLWRNIGTLAVFVLATAAVAGVISFLMTPMYRSEVVFAPADSSSGLGDLGGGQLGGLAALAGINITGGNKKSEEALEYLRSRALTAQFIQRHGLLPVLFAKKWDAQRNQWRDEPPTIAEGVEKFSHKVREVVEDRRTGIVRVSILWSDRQAAAQWANALVAEADDALRQRGIAELTRSIDYLKGEEEHTTQVEVRAALYKLMETELKNAMLARTRDAYAFKVLDPAVARDPKDRDRPNRPLIIVTGAAIGLVLGIFWARLRRARPRPG